MRNSNKADRTPKSVDLNLYTIFKDLKSEWWMILLIAVATTLLSYVWQNMHYSKQYTIKTTFVVTNRGTENDIFNNLTSAQQTADDFTTILNSSVLQRKVARDLDMGYMPGSAVATLLEETNLITLSVTENSPELAYKVMNSIMKNYKTVIQGVLDSVILDTLQSPVIPMKPDAPFQPWSKMVKVFFLSLIILCGALGLLSYFRDTIRTEKDISEKLDISLLGTIGHEYKYKSAKSLMQHEKTGILLNNPVVSFQYVESMKKTASRVRSKMDHNGVKTLLVTSVRENEGKSTVAANLALALAEESKKVLLIDGDLRKPALYKIFQTDTEKMENLGDVLNGKSDIGDLVISDENSDLKLVLNHVMYPNSTEMITEGILEIIIRFLRQKMDYIIIDSPPVALVADTEIISYMTDATLLVIHQHMAEAREINDAAAVLNQQNKGVLGCIFNDVGAGLSFGKKGDNYGKYGYGGYYAKRSKIDR